MQIKNYDFYQAPAIVVHEMEPEQAVLSGSYDFAPEFGGGLGDYQDLT